MLYLYHTSFDMRGNFNLIFKTLLKFTQNEQEKINKQ